MIELEALSVNRLTHVHPQLAAKISEMQGKLDFPIRVTQGLRTYQEQELLYEQGRSLPGKKVTNAKPGWSWHNFGNAVDCVPLGRDTKLPDWNADHPQWQQMIDAGVALGLTAGALFRTFPDMPHFQWTGKYPPSPTDEVRAVYAKGGILAVWKAAFE